jgi:hypothetical protein
MTITPGPFLNGSTQPAILPGMIVSCSNPSFTGGTVLAHPAEDWAANPSPTDDMVYVDFGGGNVIWVRAANLTVTG